MSVHSHSELELYIVNFFWIPYYVRKVLTNFENYSQLAEPIGELDQPVH